MTLVMSLTVSVLGGTGWDSFPVSTASKRRTNRQAIDVLGQQCRLTLGYPIDSAVLLLVAVNTSKALRGAPSKLVVVHCRLSLGGKRIHNEGLQWSSRLNKDPGWIQPSTEDGAFGQ